MTLVIALMLSGLCLGCDPMGTNVLSQILELCVSLQTKHKFVESYSGMVAKWPGVVAAAIVRTLCLFESMKKQGVDTVFRPFPTIFEALFTKEIRINIQLFLLQVFSACSICSV